ncbi:MAG TPA: hypothetical protein DD379_09455 [Cyanobacteria bacterium UBA11162]|nr:hypothetical protein [Cyanobacteria bacterium UBA11162]
MITKISRQLTQLTFTIPLALITLLVSTPIVKIQGSQPKQSERPEPPETGTPSGDPTPGTTRPEATCPETSKPLTALLANNGSDFTVSEYPTFWFYVPYAPNQISTIEFLLLDERERKTIYQTSVKLTERPGLIKITIPSEPQYALKLNENYRWRLNLDCEPDTTVEPDLMLNGWIQRIPITSQLENQLEAVKPKEYIAYQDNGIWYDAITNLAQLHSADPENREFAQDWANFLESLGSNWVIQEPFVDSVLLPLED